MARDQTPPPPPPPRLQPRPRADKPTQECWTCGMAICSLCGRRRHYRGAAPLHWPLVDAPGRLAELLGRRELEAKRIEDGRARLLLAVTGQRWVQLPPPPRLPARTADLSLARWAGHESDVARLLAPSAGASGLRATSAPTAPLLQTPKVRGGGTRAARVRGGVARRRAGAPGGACAGPLLHVGSDRVPRAPRGLRPPG